MNTENIVAVDYKGKHFVLTDKDMLEELDFVDEQVDVQKVIGSDRLLSSYIQDCHYYGVPTYIGGNQALKERIQALVDNPIDRQ